MNPPSNEQNEMPTDAPGSAMLRHLTALMAVLLLIGVGAAAMLLPPRTAPAADPTTPPAGTTPGPTLTPPQWALSVDQLVADGNQIVVGISYYDANRPDEAVSSDYYGQMEIDVAGDLLVGNEALPRLSSGSEIWRSRARGGQMVNGITLAFDSSGLALPALDARLVATMTVGQRNYWPGPTGGTTPQPTPYLYPYADAAVITDTVLHLNFDQRRRIATPNLTTEGRGVPLTLERVIVTASETRILVRGMANASTPRLNGDGWAVDMQGGIGNISYTADNPVGADELEFRIGAALLDKPSPWVITFPEFKGAGKDPSGWVGPWVFYFAMPQASVSLTPGPLPTLPPATPRPTDVPGAVPTQVKPISGPVPPTGMPAPSVDLSWFAQQADVIVRMNIEPASCMAHSYCFSGAVTEWLKRPANLNVDQLYFELAGGGAENSPVVVGAGKGKVHDFVVFLQQTGAAPDNNLLLFTPVDPLGAFGIADGKIALSGIGRYQGMALDSFLQEVRGLVPTPVP